MITTGLGTFVTYNPVAVTVSATLAEATALMDEQGCRHLPVVDDDRGVVGILSDQDLARAALAYRAMTALAGRAGCEPSTVEAIMTPRPFTVEGDASVRETLQTLLTRGIHCLPVVEEERLIGVLSSSDFLREFTYGEFAACRDVVQRHMHTLPTIVDAQLSLEAARVEIQEHGEEFLVVAKGDCPLGIVSLADLRRAMESGADRPRASLPVTSPAVSQLVRRDVPALRPHQTLAQAAEWMLAHAVKALVVVDRRSALSGLLSETHILQAMSEELQ